MTALSTNQIFNLIFGGTYILMGLAVWSMLPGRRLARPVRLWTLGAIALGVGALLTTVRAPALPMWLSLCVPALDMLSFSLRIQALRLHLGRSTTWRITAVAMLFAVGGYAVSREVGDRRLPFAFSNVVYGTAAGIFAWHAVEVWRSVRSRSAWLVAGTEGLLSATLLLTALTVWFTHSPANLGQVTWDFLLLFSVGTIAAVYGNLGYLGLVLDESRRAELRAREAQLTESHARASAESSAAELRTLLQQRDRLATERQRMLELLAHEIRQPLNNAGSALQATASVLQGMGGGRADQAAERLQRARSVLGNVNSVLDNTLAVADLLAQHTPLRPREVELALLIDVVLGDLDEAPRRRVQLQWHTDLRSAEVESALMRLALRNLLLNALKHGGPDARVVLEVAESTSPPALLLCVADDGPGLSEAALQAADAAQDVDAPPPERGRGLYIARTVAQRHGGQLRLRANVPHGLRACLVLPLPA